MFYGGSMTLARAAKRKHVCGAICAQIDVSLVEEIDAM